VIVWVPYQGKAVSEVLRAGARFLGLARKTLADIYTRYRNHCGAVGAMDREDTAISAVPCQIDEGCTRTGGARSPRVWCEEWGKPLIASQLRSDGSRSWSKPRVGTSSQQPAARPRLRTFAGSIRKLIIAACCGAGDRVRLEKIVVDRGWQQTAAALSGRVFCMRDEFLNTPAPTLLQGLRALAFAIHPELFPRTKGIRQITAVSASTAGSSAP
jgi:iron complex transport system substrate-binding protein